MDLEAVKGAVYDMTALFFGGATVIWAEQVNTVPALPYVMLKMGSLHRNALILVDDDGERYYQCDTTVQIDLYTRGRPVTVGDGVTGNYANTAVSDMMDFFSFVESERITDRMSEMGISIALMPPVRDLTGLQNDSKHRYRSMAEASVSFLMSADGGYGLSGMSIVPSPSGGGTADMAGVPIEPIEQIELQDG